MRLGIWSNKLSTSACLSTTGTHFEGDEIQKPQGGNALIDRLGGKLAFVEEVQLILTNSLDIENLGAEAEVFGETGDQTDIVLLGAGCQIA